MELPQDVSQGTDREREQQEPKDEAPAAKTEQSEGEARKRRARLKPNLPLPSGRLNADKEITMLRAYVSQSKAGERAVHFSDIAGLVQTHETSISASKEFWEEVGLLERTSRGEHKPTLDLVRWALKVDFNQPEANANLFRAYDHAWFGETIRGAFQVHHSMKKDLLTNILANTAGGEKNETEPRARLLVELLVSTGYLIELEGGELSMATESSSTPVQPQGPMATDGPAPPNPTLATASTGTRNEFVPALPPSQNPPVGVSLDISVSNWAVGDVIRLVKFLRTGEDARREDPDVQDTRP